MDKIDLSWLPKDFDDFIKLIIFYFVLVSPIFLGLAIYFGLADLFYYLTIDLAEISIPNIFWGCVLYLLGMCTVASFLIWSVMIILKIILFFEKCYHSLRKNGLKF